MKKKKEIENTNEMYKMYLKKLNKAKISYKPNSTDLIVLFHYGSSYSRFI